MWIAIQNAVGARQGVGGGPPPPPPYTPPLDSITAAVAYSVRKLNSTYSGDCMLVRRVSDGATQGIGFDSNGLIDVNALATFSGGSELTVKTWYDQAGGGFDLEQPNDAYLPTIYDGAAVTTSTSGKPCVRIVRAATAGPGEWLITDPVSLSTAGNMDVFLVLHGPLTSGGDRRFWDSNGGPTTSGARWGIDYGSNSYKANGQGGTLTTAVLSNSVPIPNSLQFIHNTRFYSNLEIYGNGVEFGSVVGTNTSRTDPYNVALGARVTGTEGYNSFDISEIIHLPNYGVSNNESINLNINDYYQFTNLPYYSSGLLADYSGAAAAYSVRKLSNTAIKCMRVRRTVSPFDELDIGFTPAGDLDEAAIVAFGAGNPLTVSRWYDQSGQSNHALQVTAGSQPQIYNGTAVRTDNGKPTLVGSGGQTLTIAELSLTDFGIAYTGHLQLGDSPYGKNSNDFSLYGLTSTVLRNRVAGANYNFTDSGLVYGTQLLSFYNRSSGSVTLRRDGSQVGTSTYSDPVLINTILGSPPYNLIGNVQELVIWDSTRDSQFTGIETNINDYYYAYNTSGFVVDYPGAIAAYSVRQLGNRQRYAMRVRRLGGAADYLDVGFVAGELDTQAIIDFGGSDTLGVEVWYDQSRSGNDVTNTSTTTMPIIYNGSSVITDGGKPALGRNSAGLYYSIGNIVPVGVTQASFISVVQGPDAGTLTRIWHGSGGGSLNSLTTGNNLYIYNGGSPQFGSGPAVGRTLGIQLTDGNPGAAEKGWRNGVLNYSADSGPNSPRTNILGSTTLAQTPLFMQEMILYPSDIDAGGTRINIETNINTYYGIY